MDGDTLAPLNLLLKAKSKEFVARVFHEAFRYRNTGGVFPDAVVSTASEALGVEAALVTEVFKSAAALVKHVVFEELTDAQAIISLFPSEINDKLKQLITKIVVENVATWKSQALNQQISLPRLLDFDWRVDIKTSASNFSRLAMPTCLLQLQVQDMPSTSDGMPGVRHLNVEFSRETLDTMLDGLGKIRDQLSSVAQATAAQE